jgi:phospholipid/cholesterol/gamma-HCH transport system substrate-binding protein
MIFGRSKLELKVGIFVFGGLIILFAAVLMIGKFKTWTSGYRVNVIFSFVNGVKIGAPVRFAGMDVGEVLSLNIYYSPEEAKSKVKVVTWVNKEIKIPADSTVWVNTLGLLGEKYIEMPGKNYDKPVLENQTIIGTDPLAMHELGVFAKKIADDLDETIVKIKEGQGTVGKLLNNDAIYNEIEAALKNKNGTIGRFFYDDSIYKDVQGLILDLKKHPWKLFWKGKE